MSNISEIPFNVKILVLTPEKLNGIKPVRVLDSFDGNSTNFHEDGLFSVSIFGRVGDKRRSSRFSYIDIKVPIFHPVIYNTLISLKRLYGDILTGKAYATWNNELKDFDRSDAVNGETGYAYFMEYFNKIDFKVTDSVKREQNILLIDKYKDVATTSKIIVMPAGLRDMEIGEDGRMQCDEINTLYRKLISISNTITDVAIKSNPEIINAARVNLQLTFNDIYNTIESMIEGKKKLILGKWASRKIFNGTRNVITTMDTSSHYLGSPGSVDINTTIAGLYQGLRTIMPVARYHIRNGFLSKVFIDTNRPAKLVDKKTRKSVDIMLKPYQMDKWMSNEGIEKIISSFSEVELRNKPLEIEGHYIGLIYKGPDNTFKIIQDIDDVPGTRSKLDVYPLTFCELLYLSCYRILDKYPTFITRYPIAGVGSIVPTKVHIKTTIKVEQRRELNDNWEPMDDTYIATEFPTDSPYLDSMVPNIFRIKGLAADFDR